MKLKPNLLIRKVGNQYVLFDDSATNLDYSRVINLNETAAFLINRTKEENFSVTSWAEALVAEYDVEMERAIADVEHLVTSLREQNLIIAE